MGCGDLGEMGFGVGGCREVETDGVEDMGHQRLDMAMVAIPQVMGTVVMEVGRKDTCLVRVR